MGKVMETTSTLQAWIPFYTLVGSAAAALTGLMFVVITLVSSRGRQSTSDGVSTYSTPTVVHYAVVLFVSALLCAPWPDVRAPEIVLGIVGLGGVAYVIVLIARAQTLDAYKPDAEEWVWFGILPLVGYASIATSAALALASFGVSPYIRAGGVTLLVLVGIHNAWDIVTYLALRSDDQ
jgi:hypothetical protein